VLVAKAADIAEEYYFSVLLDGPTAPTCDGLPRGGMEIEQLAEDVPDALAKIPWTRLEGIDPAKAAEIVEAVGSLRSCG